MLTSPKPTLLRISNGLALRYEKTGEGPPLVLMHTIRTQLEYFRSLAPVLARSYTVYAIDLPGHGHSPIDPLARFDEPYFRQGVIGFIEKLNLTDVTLVGESIGGALALTVAAAISQRVRRVVAVNPYDYETRMEMASDAATGSRISSSEVCKFRFWARSMRGWKTSSCSAR